MYNKRFDLNSNHHQCKVNNNTFKPKLQQLNLDTVHCTLLHISQNNLNFGFNVLLFTLH